METLVLMLEHQTFLFSGQAQLKGSQLTNQTIQVQAQTVQQQVLQQQVQVKQGPGNIQAGHPTGKTPSKTPGQRRRSQNK